MARTKNTSLGKDIVRAMKKRNMRQRIVYVLPEKLVKEIRETLPKAAEKAAEIPKAAAVPHSEVLDKLNVLITSAFGLVAALAWNSAIQKVFESYPHLKSYGPWAYAITVTIIAVMITVWLGRLTTAAKGKEKIEKKEELKDAKK